MADRGPLEIAALELVALNPEPEVVLVMVSELDRISRDMSAALRVLQARLEGSLTPELFPHPTTQ